MAKVLLLAGNKKLVTSPVLHKTLQSQVIFEVSRDLIPQNQEMKQNETGVCFFKLFPSSSSPGSVAANESQETWEHLI